MAGPTQPLVPRDVPTGASPDGGAIVVGTGAVMVDLYIDFLCPFCRAFVQRDGAALDRMADDGAISLAWHPLGLLDRLTSTRYSTRASASAGCASDGGRFRRFLPALYDKQSAEGNAGLSDHELIELGASIGLGEMFASCVAAGRYIAWSEFVTARAAARGISATPSVLVDRRPVRARISAITSAVAGQERR